MSYRRVAFAAVILAAAAAAAQAQSIGQIARTQGREAAIAAARAQDAASGRGQPYGAPRIAPPATIDGANAVVTAPRACAPNMQMQMRLKQERPIIEMAQPDAYMAFLNGTLSLSMLRMRMAGECSTAQLTVFGPAGQLVAQDSLTFQDGGWKSARAQQILQQRAMATPAPGSFGPGGVTDVRDTLRARARLGEQERSACIARQAQQSEALRLERQRRGVNGYGPADVAPGSPLWRVNEELKACLERAKGGGADIYAGVEKAASDFAAKQPASYDGLRAIKQARADYRKSLTTGRGDAENQQALGRVDAVLGRRASEIETALRPQILADLNKSGDTSLLDNLFGYDKAREQAYATDIYPASYTQRLPKRADGSKPFYLRTGETEKSRREAEQAAAFRTWTEPTETEIALSMLRALRVSGGRQLSPNVVTVPGALNRIGFDGLDSLANMKMQMFDARKQRCAKVAEGYRCTFTVYARMIAGGAYGGDSLGVMNMAGLDTNNMLWGVQTQTLFTPTRDGWRVPEREAAVAQGQATQMQQLTDAAGRVVDAGANAMQVMTGQFQAPDQDSDQAQLDKQRRERQEQADKRRN